MENTILPNLTHGYLRCNKIPTQRLSAVEVSDHFHPTCFFRSWFDWLSAIFAVHCVLTLCRRWSFPIKVTILTYVILSIVTRYASTNIATYYSFSCVRWSVCKPADTPCSHLKGKCRMQSFVIPHDCIPVLPQIYRVFQLIVPSPSFRSWHIFFTQQTWKSNSR